MESKVDDALDAFMSLAQRLELDGACEHVQQLMYDDSMHGIPELEDVTNRRTGPSVLFDCGRSYQSREVSSSQRQSGGLTRSSRFEKRCID